MFDYHYIQIDGNGYVTNFTMTDDPSLPSPWISIPVNNAMWPNTGDAYHGGAVHFRPYRGLSSEALFQSFEFNFTSGEWEIVDLPTWTAYVKEQAGQHRDYLISTLPNVTITSDTYKLETVDPLEPYDADTNPYKLVLDQTAQTFTLSASERTKTALNSIAVVQPNHPTQPKFIKFDFVEGAYYVPTENVVAGAVVLRDAEQNIFNAYGLAMDKHEVTPYLHIQDVLDDMDGFVTSPLVIVEA